MNDQTIKKFMQRCKKEHGFTLLAIYPCFVTNLLDLTFVESVIHNNRYDFPGAFTTIKNFIIFLFDYRKSSWERLQG